MSSVAVSVLACCFTHATPCLPPLPRLQSQEMGHGISEAMKQVRVCAGFAGWWASCASIRATRHTGCMLGALPCALDV